MFYFFIYFLLGVETLRILQFFLSITPNYNIYKQTEYINLRILSELYMQQLTALKILKITYEGTNSLNEYEEIEKHIKQKNLTLINNTITEMKKHLPYTVPYSTIEEAVRHYLTHVKLEKKDD